MLLPSPKKCLGKIDQIIPETIKQRTEISRRWLVEALKALNITASTVEDFVEQSNSLNRVQD